MKVWILDPSAFTTRYDVCLCEGLAKSEANVTLMTRQPRAGEMVPFSTKFKTEFFFFRIVEGPLAFLNFFRPLWLFLKGLEFGLNLLFLILRARREKPEAIHYEWLTLALFDGVTVRLLKRICPVFLTVHDIKPFLGASSGRLQTSGWGWAMRGFDGYIVHSPPSQKALVEAGFKDKSISVIPCGVLESPQATAPRAKEDFRRILLFGNLKPYKGLDILIEAFGKIPARERTTWRIRVAGRKAMELGAIEKRAQELGVAEQIEWDLRFFSEEEIPQVFAQSDIYVFPYKEIDTSAVFFTSLGRGRPIVATRIGAFAERIQDGQSGLLFEVDNSTQLANHLQRLMGDPELRDRLGENTKLIMDATPGWDDIGERTLRFYEETRPDQ